MTVRYDPLGDEEMFDARPAYAELRAHDPVHYMQVYDAWALAGFDVVWQACSDTVSFSVRRGQTPYQVLLGEPAMNLTFPELDPPEHRLRRRVLSPYYTREAAHDDAAMIRAIAADVLLPLLERGSFDAFDDYASQVASQFAARKAGVPADDADRIRRLLHDAIAREPGQRGTTAANAHAMATVFGELHGLIGLARSDRSMAAGLLAELLDATVDGRALDDAQIAAELHTLLVTGSETVELAVGAALVNLARETEQCNALLADPTLAAAAFAEAVRFDHPTDMLCRVVERDVVVGDKQLRRGQGVLLLWGSANRDESVFAHADRFDMNRRSERTLLFGHGQHKCIGEHLGMRMGAIILETLFAAIGAYEIDEMGLRRRRGEFLKGYNVVPVTLRRR